MKIYIQTVRDQGHCVKGLRDLFKAHGFDDIEFKSFIDNGIDHELIAHIDDFRIKSVVKKALEDGSH